MTNYPQIKLKLKKEQPIQAGHPWVFSNAIEKDLKEKKVQLAEIITHDGAFIGIGIWNPKTTIRIRLLSLKKTEIDEVFFVNKFLELDARKRAMLPQETTTYRIVHGDADFCPGLIVDRYENVLVFQIHTAGMDLLKPLIISALTKAFNPEALVERSDVDSRKQEGLHDFPIVVHSGKINGLVPFTECGNKFLADVLKGQKTGFFIDQRDTRSMIGKLSSNRNVLNLFCYSGASSIYAYKGGASNITMIDASNAALNMVKENFIVNEAKEFLENNCTLLNMNVFDYFSDNASKDKLFDMIICDPPAFAKTKENVESALKAYLTLNEKCIRHLSKDGILVTSSCSGRVSLLDFKNSIRHAAGRERVDLQLISTIGHAIDHTDKISFPEGQYLKTLILKRI